MGDGLTSEIAKASNQFGYKLYQKLVKEEFVENFVVSPFSLHVALTLVLQGAGGNTAAELATVLALSDVNLNVKESYKSLLTGLQGKSLNLAVKLFPSNAFRIKPEFVGCAREFFRSDVENIDFDNMTQAVSTINDYVAQRTNNKIQGLVDIDTLLNKPKLIIINALHFEATWRNKFNPAVRGPTFKVTPEEEVPAEMMGQRATFDYNDHSHLGAQILKMDYENGKHSMILILPKKIDGLADLEKKMDNYSVDDIIKDLKPTDVGVSIPKFQLDNKIELVRSLLQMGISDLFDMQSNLDNMGEGKPGLANVLQKAFIDVNEEGTEASAATAINVPMFSPGVYVPPSAEFTADHPFFFMLVQSDLVLFYGRFVRPD